MKSQKPAGHKSGELSSQQVLAGVTSTLGATFDLQRFSNLANQVKVATADNLTDDDLVAALALLAWAARGGSEIRTVLFRHSTDSKGKEHWLVQVAEEHAYSEARAGSVSECADKLWRGDDPREEKGD